MYFEDNRGNAAVLTRDNMELSGSLGIHNLRLEAGLRATLTVGGGGGTVDLEEVANGDGPLPVLGQHFLWDVGNHVFVDAHSQFVFAEIDNYDGGWRITSWAQPDSRNAMSELASVTTGSSYALTSTSLHSPGS